jgi:hypothetical protein
VRIYSIFVARLLAFVLLCLALSAQDLNTPPPESQSGRPDAFFSGTVVDYSTDRLTVSRTILGRPAEQRSFVITSDTKIEGKLSDKSRVTVRYRVTEDGDVAVSVLVRGRPKK